jgi:hypothetical protein
MSDEYEGSHGFDWNAAEIHDTLDSGDFGQSEGREPDPITLEPESDIPSAGEAVLTPDASTVGGKGTRTRGAAGYEKKLRKIFATAIKITAQRESTAPDAAALIMMSPKVAQSGGDLAAVDARFARGIDMLFDGSENPYLNFAVAMLPLAAQIARNHEPTLEPKSRGIRIPILNRRISIPFKLGIRIGALRSVTNEPRSIADYVLNDPAVREAFAKQEVPVAWNNRSSR